MLKFALNVENAVSIFQTKLQVKRLLHNRKLDSCSVTSKCYHQM